MVEGEPEYLAVSDALVKEFLMIPMRPIEQINEKRLRRSIQAYLEGEQNLRWALGVIGIEHAPALRLLAAFQTFVGTRRYSELKAALETVVAK